MHSFFHTPYNDPVCSRVIALQNVTLKFLKPTRKLFLVSLERCGEFNLILFADEDEEKPEVKVTADTDSEDEEVEEATETTTPADKPSVPPLNSTRHTQHKSAATVSLITKHNNGTLNMWNVMFADKSRFTSLLNISHKSRASGHRFRVNDINCHPVLPLLLTTSHHNVVHKTNDATATDVSF